MPNALMILKKLKLFVENAIKTAIKFKMPIVQYPFLPTLNFIISPVICLTSMPAPFFQSMMQVK